MRILITAGGTTEKIDDVRAITNHSSGRLGKAIAEAFLSEDATIDYITIKPAVKPDDSRISLHLIESTAGLAAKLKELMTANKYTAVIHSMAVSDFTPESSITLEDLQQTVSTNPVDLAAALKAKDQERTEKKISSDTDHLVIILKKNPKVIQQIKELQPETTLVGFKLLVDVPMIQLLDVAKKSLEKNQADFILANDLTEISGETHHGYLINRQHKVKEAHTKSEIAQLIKEAVLERKNA
ncbi:phosphopantothenate--cysteine ligase [Enterococcus pallens]|uniref:Phosphopantothenate-cysteine ligase n=1 Tax=Enterococcus pallens ATCC BAA-351 TaxID=1158607 RepID=R2SZB8_9ENTE|nr:phosphopantothenate--cysteine ligase [Enterococcus pallens]EOH98111.1 phosphopantothenate-cysteine ligase [Enterococcus pallens ATCC BAA-351]EOU14641.1 phosphopantothenate-cysteine ligase [Enterococcus pallens ATCC BAA-351]